MRKILPIPPFNKESLQLLAEKILPKLSSSTNMSVYSESIENIHDPKLLAIFKKVDAIILFRTQFRHRTCNIARLSASTDKQHCSGYFLKQEFQEQWGLSDKESQLLTLDPMYADLFLSDFGYVPISKGKAIPSKFPKDLQLGDKIALFNNKKIPIHYLTIDHSRQSSNETQYLIDHKMGPLPASHNTWHKTITHYTRMMRQPLSYQVFRKS